MENTEKEKKSQGLYDYTEEELEKLFIPESSSEIKLRMLATAWYVFILLGIGVPTWYYTTRVYRASLPLQDMLEMESVPAQPLSVLVHASTHARSQLLTEEIQSLLGDTISVTIHNEKITLPITGNERDIEIAAKNIMVKTGHVLLIEWPKSNISLMLTSRRVVYFKSDVSGYRLAMFLENWPGVELKTALTDPNLEDTRVRIMRPFRPAPRYDLLLTVVNPEPHQLKVEWDVKRAIQEYLQPFTKSISHIMNFTIKSQWLYLVELGVKPRLVGDHFALSEVLLPHIISPLEKKLSSAVSKDPCINLVAYVPSCESSPIHIYSRQGIKSQGLVDAFVSPRWGGVLIANPTCPNTTFDLSTQNWLYMPTFITHLHQLLGIPDFKSVILDEVAQSGKMPSQWQMDYLMRTHTLENLDAARLSLRSLAKLLTEISNIVIKDETAEFVKTSIHNINEAERLLKEGDVLAAFRASQTAHLNAEKAFSHPSLLALLYFPDDQKYAIYIPLFLPIMIPVVISVGALVKYYSTPKTEKRNMLITIVVIMAYLSIFIPFDQILQMLLEQKFL